MAVKFQSVDLKARTATFDVDGESVTRGIADDVVNETLKDHLIALAQGLAIEYTAPVELSESAPFAAGEEIA